MKLPSADVTIGMLQLHRHPSPRVYRVPSWEHARGRQPCAPDPRLASGISSVGSSLSSLGNIFCNKLTDVIQCFSDFSAVQAGYQIPGGNLDSQLLSQKSQRDPACLTLTPGVRTQSQDTQLVFRAKGCLEWSWCAVCKGSSWLGSGPVAQLCTLSCAHATTVTRGLHL